MRAVRNLGRDLWFVDILMIKLDKKSTAALVKCVMMEQLTKYRLMIVYACALDIIIFPTFGNSSSFSLKKKYFWQKAGPHTVLYYHSMYVFNIASLNIFFAVY